MSLPLGLPRLGFGVGLRSTHFRTILDNQPPIDWFEIISENFIDTHGRPRQVLLRIAERYPLVMHGVSMSIGSTDELNLDYLARLRALAEQVKPRWISDHLCWTGVQGINSHDLLPMPLNEQSLRHVAGRVRRVQEILERPLILENPSTYVGFVDSTMSEPDFLSALVAETGCGILLDVNNIHVSCFNHDLDPVDYLQRIPHRHVVQFHLAGHTHLGTHIIDTHDDHVVDAVWRLYRLAVERCGLASTLIEWDAKIPPLDVVRAEAARARAVALGGPAAFGSDRREAVLDEVEPASHPGASTVPQPAHRSWVEVE
jgi:hypothetical protein